MNIPQSSYNRITITVTINGLMYILLCIAARRNFFKLLDASSQGDILVDRFVVNITDVPIGSTSDRTYLGIFGLASVDIRIALVCSPGYIGPDCSTECHNETCTCPPGFTGPFCATSITQNCSVNCSGEGDDHTTTSDITSPDLDNNSHENHTPLAHCTSQLA